MEDIMPTVIFAVILLLLSAWAINDNEDWWD